MNYAALKWMVDSLIKSYKCPSCNNPVSEDNVDIIWAAWTTVNMDIWCTKCKKHSMIKVEVVWIDLTEMNIPENKLNEITRGLKMIKWNKSKLEDIDISKEEKIKDEHIVNLSKNLKERSLKVDDLFKK